MTKKTPVEEMLDKSGNTRGARSNRRQGLREREVDAVFRWIKAEGLEFPIIAKLQGKMRGASPNFETDMDPAANAYASGQIAVMHDVKACLDSLRSRAKFTERLSQEDDRPELSRRFFAAYHRAITEGLADITDLLGLKAAAITGDDHSRMTIKA